MDIEQLKLVIDMLSNAGEGVFWIAILWIAKGYFIGMLVAGTIITSLFLVLGVVKKTCNDSARKAVEQISGRSFSNCTDAYVMSGFWEKITASRPSK